MLNLEEIAAACEAATAGPWEITEEPKGFIDVTYQGGKCRIATVGYRSDAKLLANSRQWVPELVAEVRRLGQFEKAHAELVREKIPAMLREMGRLQRERDAAIEAIKTVLQDEGDYCEEHCKTTDCSGCVRASMFDWKGLKDQHETQTTSIRFDKGNEPDQRGKTEGRG